MDLTLSKKLEELINSGIETAPLPYVKGNSIRIKNIVIRKSKAGWLLYDIETHTQLARFFCRNGALAYANNLVKNRGNYKTICDLDKTVEKHYTDCLFYLNTMKKTKNNLTREVVKVRYDISYAETRKATENLNRIIMH